MAHQPDFLGLDQGQGVRLEQPGAGFSPTDQREATIQNATNRVPAGAEVAPEPIDRAQQSTTQNFETARSNFQQQQQGGGFGDALATGAKGLLQGVAVTLAAARGNISGVANFFAERQGNIEAKIQNWEGMSRIFTDEIASCNAAPSDSQVDCVAASAKRMKSQLGEGADEAFIDYLGNPQLVQYILDHPAMDIMMSEPENEAQAEIKQRLTDCSISLTKSLVDCYNEPKFRELMTAEHKREHGPAAMTAARTLIQGIEERANPTDGSDFDPRARVIVEDGINSVEIMDNDFLKGILNANGDPMFNSEQFLTANQQYLLLSEEDLRAGANIDETKFQQDLKKFSAEADKKVDAALKKADMTKKTVVQVNAQGQPDFSTLDTRIPGPGDVPVSSISPGGAATSLPAQVLGVSKNDPTNTVIPLTDSAETRARFGPNGDFRRPTADEKAGKKPAEEGPTVLVARRDGQGEEFEADPDDPEIKRQLEEGGNLVRRSRTQVRTTLAKSRTAQTAALKARTLAVEGAVRAVNISSLLDELERIPGVIGVSGKAGDFLGRLLSQINKGAGEDLTQLLTGANQEEISAFKVRMQGVVVDKIPVVTGEESGRITKEELSLTRDMMQAFELMATPASVAGALSGAMIMSVADTEIKLAQANIPPTEDLNTDKGKLAFLKKYSRLGLSDTHKDTLLKIVFDQRNLIESLGIDGFVQRREGNKLLGNVARIRRELGITE